MDYLALKNEILNDPKSLGLNTIGLSGETIDRDIVPTYEIFEATIPAEFATLTAAEKQRYQIILSMGNVNTKGANTRASFQAMFAVGTQTRANLVTLLTRLASRVGVLGFRSVNRSDVAQALRRI
jgi:hypothetical protein